VSINMEKKATYKSNTSGEVKSVVAGVSATAEINTTSTLVLVTEIWQRIFGRSPISPDADFFDLGGDSFLATQLLAEIETATGRDLPAEILFGAPTIASIARALEESDPLQASSLVQMKAGHGAANLFVIPGASGSILQLRPVVANISLPISIYAVKPKGLTAVEAPLETIEAMAEHGLDAIKTIDKAGPYLIMGYSAGGLVAFEMAIRLVAAGKCVQMLALLDTYPIERAWPVGCHFSVLADAFITRLRQFKRGQSDEDGSFVLRRFAGLSKYLLRTLGFSAHYPWLAPGVHEAGYQFYVATEDAVTRYSPRYYDGKITFFQASEHHLEPSDPRKVWRRFARELEVHNVPGDHVVMIGRDAEALGARLTFCLEAALAQIEDPKAELQRSDG
jgi:acetoacetyl-CoA synthetase